MAPPEARLVPTNHPDKIRILVLETDETHPRTRAEKGSFGDVFAQLFRKAGDAHDPPLGVETLMQYIVEPDGGKIPSVEEITEDVHAILITGSTYDAHSDEDWIVKLVKLIQRLSSIFTP